MKLNAVGVTTTNLQKSVEFYRVLGFEFPEFKKDEQHLESIPKEGSIRLMIDLDSLVESIIGEMPHPGNHSSFAIEYDTAKELDRVSRKIKDNGYTVVKDPWNAFWGQRYAIVEDPDGYKVDLYASLK